MMNDSVREELQSKVVSGSLRLEIPEPPPRRAASPNPPILEVRAQPAPVRKQPAPIAKRIDTAGLRAPKTSPTLVDFQNKDAPLPEWRLQMQNAVRQRRGEIGVEAENVVQPSTAAGAPNLTRGAAAVQKPEGPNLENADPRLAAALRRIQESQKKFLPNQPPVKPPVKSTVKKSFPFDVVAPRPNPPVRPPAQSVANDARPKPAMVTPLRMEKKLDTNKLPRIETVIEPSEISEPLNAEPNGRLPISGPSDTVSHTEFSEVHRIVINAEHDDSEAEDIDQFDEDIEDLAPFSMRFNAGVFDLIIGAFISMIVLSPIVLTGSNWLSVAGMLTFAGTCAFVLFVYMTASIGFFGKTLGMRLFSLELVDAEENEHPTLHQAAVNSSLFIISLLFGGAGFVTVLFNEEKRAVHDLLSGTIIVREF